MGVEKIKLVIPKNPSGMKTLELKPRMVPVRDVARTLTRTVAPAWLRASESKRLSSTNPIDDNVGENDCPMG